MKKIISLLVLAVIGAIGFVALSYISMQQSLPGTVQDLLDKNFPKNALKVAFVKIPITAAIPFIGPAKSEGYFMIEKKGGGELIDNCRFEPFDLEVRDAANSQYAIYVPGEDMKKLQECYFLAGISQ
ncbi:hypothetical protein [Mesorhizobium sp.]|uniref:hypothetical protein n=1 Tax=Mesorhizobium sp. TaxID=1871066 RepID=UPI000FE645E3|nr:hypothetical protein [Mesorhizobium sp.]RWA59459.1 MAG: hypothetical protein EOQ27_26430 [Mesorhizobium sp.]